MTLFDAPKGTWLEVKKLKNGKLQSKLAGHGLFIGDRLRVLRAAPLDGPFLIEINNRQIALGRGIAREILVEIIE
jgi:Fe2+ transport system protein FeoA